MHITRVVTKRQWPDSGRNRLLYYLNGIYVYVGYNARFVSVGGKPDQNVVFRGNERIIELADKIGTNDHGNIKVDTTNTDILDFLKTTKCIQ